MQLSCFASGGVEFLQQLRVRAPAFDRGRLLAGPPANVWARGLASHARRVNGLLLLVVLLNPLMGYMADETGRSG